MRLDVATLLPPLISVICVTRRPERLQNSIFAFRNQTYEQKEFIVVSESQNRRSIIPLLTQRNEKFISAHGTLGLLRNVAVAYARGKYIMQWDDDDLYHPERISLMISDLLSRPAKKCALLYQWFIMDNRSGHMFLSAKRSYFGWEGSILAERSLLYNCYPNMTRSRDGRFGEDFACVRTIAKRCLRTNRPYLYVYVSHDGQTTTKEHQNDLIMHSTPVSLRFPISPTISDWKMLQNAHQSKNHILKNSADFS